VNSFDAVARERFDVKQGGWAPGHSEKSIARLENDIFPGIGRTPVASVTLPPMLHERVGFSPNVIEAQLAHSVRESLGHAYHRTEIHRTSSRDAAAMGGRL